MDEDIEELKNVMNTLKDTVPALIKGIIDALYSAQNAEDFGKQVANFYKAMVEAGMDKEKAYELTREFMESRDVVGIIKKVLSKGEWSKWANMGNKKEIEKEIEEEIEREIKKEIEKE